MFHWRSKVSALWLHARTKLHDRIWSLYTETRYSSVHSTSICFTIQTNKEDTETKKKRVWNHFSSSGSNTKASFKTNYTIYIYIYNYTLFDWNDLRGIQEKMEPETMQTDSLLLFLHVFCEFFLKNIKLSFVVFSQNVTNISRRRRWGRARIKCFVVFSSFYVKVSII